MCFNFFSVFIIMKRGEMHNQARNHKSYPGALSDKIKPDKKVKNNFTTGLIDINHILLVLKGKWEINQKLNKLY